LDVSKYRGSKGNSNLKTELRKVFASLDYVKDNHTDRYRKLKRHHDENGEGHLLLGFGVGKFRMWMERNDQKHAPPDLAVRAILSFIYDMRNPEDEVEEEYKQGRVTAMCFALLLTEKLMQPLERNESHIKILGATMLHSLTTHVNSSRPLWEHICDVIYPPEQHKEKSELYRYVAACTMGDYHFNFSILDGFCRPTCSCSSGCQCNETFVRAEDSLGIFLKSDIAESATKWDRDNSTTKPMRQRKLSDTQKGNAVKSSNKRSA